MNIKDEKYIEGEKPKMNGFEQLLLDFKSMGQSKAQQGTMFELLMKKYFLTCPLYAETFEAV